MNRPIIITVLFFSLLIPVALGLDYTDIYEDFDNSTRIASIDGLIVNSSYGWVQFNNSVLSDELSPEDTGDYTLVDVDSVSGEIVIINSTSVFMDGIDRDETEYNYLNMSGGYFENFTCEWDITVTDANSNPQALSVSWANSTGAFDATGDRVGIKVVYVISTSEYRLQLWLTEGGGTTIDNYYLGSGLDFKRWLTFTMNGGACVLKVYDDKDRTSLDDTLNVAFSGNTKFDIIFWGQTDDDSVGGRSIDFFINNLKFRNSSLTSGHFTTVNFLDGISDKATAILYNESATSGAVITLEVSDDNSTWYSSQDLAGAYDTLRNGTRGINLEAVEFTDLYLRFNYTRALGSDILTLNDVLIIYESAGGGSIEYRYGVGIVLLILGVLFALGIRNE